MRMFLATTALEEFWDTSQKIVFLGDWCKLFSRKKKWESLDFEDGSVLWDSPDEIIQAISFCDDVYEKALGQVTDILNDVHQLTKDKEYYRLVLGNWLLIFIQQLYDKYSAIKKFFDSYPDAETWVLDEGQQYISLSLDDYLKKIFDDRFCLQMYSQILRAMGKEFLSKKLGEPIVASKKIIYKKDKLLFSWVAKVMRKFSFSPKATISCAYFSYNRFKQYQKLLLKGRNQVIYDDMNYDIDVPFEIDQELRGRCVLNLGENEFEEIVSKLCFQHLPVIYLEGFDGFRRSVLALPIKRTPIYFTSIGLQTNNVLKFYLAEYRDEVKICNIQHGGGYGIYARISVEDYEKSVCDIFYNWGYERTEHSKVLSHPKLCNNVKIKNGDGILLIMNSRSRYIYRLEVNLLAYSIIKKDVGNLIDFLQHIRPEFQLIGRNATDQHQWYEKERILEKCQNITFDDGSKSFLKVCNAARVCVFNHLGTTYLECLLMNKPTIIFVPKDVYQFRASAVNDFKELERVKIFHYSYQSAAEHLNQVYDDIDAWWLSDDVQQVRKKFVDKFAYQSLDWAQDWVEEFDALLKESQYC